MIPIEYYIPTYFTCLSFVLIFTCLPLLKYRNLADFPGVNLKAGSFLLFIVTIGFIGLRDPQGAYIYFGDTGAYTRTFELIDAGGDTEFNKDVGFYLYMKLCSAFMGVQGFYLLSALLYVGLPYWSLKKWLEKYVFFGLAAVVVSMSFWGFGINGVRNGLASSIFIFALGQQNKKIWMYVLFVASVSFHKSMLLPILAFHIGYYYKNTKVLLLVWLAAIPFSLLLGQNIETILSDLFTADTVIADNRATTFFTGEQENKYTEQRFRLDFVIYSAIPILMAGWYLFKQKYKDEFYTWLVNMYLVANAIWIVLIYVPYTNRVAYLSWFMMPIILIYPFIKKTRSQPILYVIFGSLLFTLFMQFK